MTSGATATNAATATPLLFSDAHSGDYFYIPVQYLAGAGAVSGYNSSPPCAPGQTPCFNPFANTTRGQVVKIIVIAFGLRLAQPAQPSFSDVSVGSPFYPFVETALAHGIVNGYDDHTFHPFANVTRGQLAKIIALAGQWPLLHPANPTFQDVPPGSAFYDFVETAVIKGVISGYDTADGRQFRPGANALRAQIAKLVYLARPQNN